jgi:uncharacterized membrane protein YfhO
MCGNKIKVVLSTYNNEVLSLQYICDFCGFSHAIYNDSFETRSSKYDNEDKFIFKHVWKTFTSYNGKVTEE